MPSGTAQPVGGGQQEIRPGPIRQQSDLPAKPEEIVCVEVEKVFDYCFQEEVCTRTMPLFGLPETAQVTCTLNTEAATCRVVGEPKYTDGGMANVTLRITVPATVQAPNQAPTTINFICFKSIQLNMPAGTNVACEVTGSAFCHLLDTNGDNLSDELFCQAAIVVVVETKARVKLLIPSFGFCAPALFRETAPVRASEFSEG